MDPLSNIPQVFRNAHARSFGLFFNHGPFLFRAVHLQGEELSAGIWVGSFFPNRRIELVFCHAFEPRRAGWFPLSTPVRIRERGVGVGPRHTSCPFFIVVLRISLSAIFCQNIRKTELSRVLQNLAEFYRDLQNCAEKYRII